MDTTVEKLKKYSSDTPSRWREEAEYRKSNRDWLRYSQMIAVKMLGKMQKVGMTQKVLAEKMGCTQQYVSKILRGKENLSLETLCKIEDALDIRLVYETESV